MEGTARPKLEEQVQGNAKSTNQQWPVRDRVEGGVSMASVFSTVRKIPSSELAIIGLYHLHPCDLKSRPHHPL